MVPVIDAEAPIAVIRSITSITMLRAAPVEPALAGVVFTNVPTDPSAVVPAVPALIVTVLGSADVAELLLYVPVSLARNIEPTARLALTMGRFITSVSVVDIAASAAVIELDGKGCT
jgi:hypothetical protein